MTRTEQVATWACASLLCACIGYGSVAVHVLPEPVRGWVGWTISGAAAVEAAVFTALAVRAWARPGRHR
jgi:hypothetical protein